ncbi:MAG: SDR family NAD(P)-dependent oxidoreductase [Gulosibacter sp.]|uniref:SDR family NAD(P)-dependent oxidoreductase n=1 Tax=Gulosibacter sp. TaxID=2817531 RepID=UPI003F91AA94
MSDSRVVFITGASGGQGRVAVDRFAREGYRVIAADLSSDAVEGTRSEVLRDLPEAEILALAVDQSSQESLQEAANRVREWAARIDTLVLFAGVLQREGKPVFELPIEDWDRVHNVNLRGTFLACRELGPLIPENAGGSIVTIASWWGREAHGPYSAYCTSKAGVISFTHTLARELAEKGIRVNCVAPGNIDTPMHRHGLQSEADERGISYEEMRDIEWGKIPLKIAGPAHTIVDAAFFLASDQASYMTGATLDVNGGVVMV